MYDMHLSDMYPPTEQDELPPAVEEQWKKWVAQETQLRALLGHYVLDGHISEYSGSPTCQRHTTHSLPSPSDDTVFNASTAEAWVEIQKRQKTHRVSFLRQFNTLFSKSVHPEDMGISLTELSARVLLEGIKSFVVDSSKHDGHAVGVPSRADIDRASGHLYRYITSSTNVDSVSKLSILLRWHTIGIDAAVNFSWLCRSLCQHLKIEQRLFHEKEMEVADFAPWSASRSARLGLLHAICIHRILQELSLTRMQSFHAPAATFSAGMVYCAFLIAGTSKVSNPNVINWETLMVWIHDSPESSKYSGLDTDVRRFLEDPSRVQGPSMNITYDLNLFRSTLQTLEQVWGIAGTMYSTLNQVATGCT